MMGRKAAQNMYSSNTNKIGIGCICWFYSQGIVTMYGHTILNINLCIIISSKPSELGAFFPSIFQIKKCIQISHLTHHITLDFTTLIISGER